METRDEKKEPLEANGPAYYTRILVQPIEYMHLVLSKEEFRGYCIGNIMKYLSRYGHKDDRKKEARKILDYARWLYQNESTETISVRGNEEPRGMKLGEEDQKKVDEMVKKLMGRDEKEGDE